MRSPLQAWRRRLWQADPAALAKFEGLRPVTVVTGGSEGIGFELARRFASAGHDLLLVARHRERLDRAAAQIKAEAKVEVGVAAIDLNVRALAALTLHYLPGMLVRGRGGILNVASLGGYVPGPNQAAYYASK